MQFPSYLATGLAAIAIVSTPLTAQAQQGQQGQPRALTEQERNFVQVLEQVTAKNPSPFMRLIADWGKADDGQLVCAALSLGATPKEISRRAVERSRQLSGRNTQENFLRYFNGIFVVAPATLCPEHKEKMEEYLQSQSGK